MSGKKGRSGRKPLVEELRRKALIGDCYEVTQAYVNFKTEPLKDRAQVAVGVVKVDMAKPIVIDQSKHVHLATINVKELTDEQLAEIALGRSSGLPARNGIENGTPNSL